MKKHYRFKLRLDRPDANGEYPVIMVITKDRKRQFISLKNVSAKPEYWDSEKECLVLFDNCNTKEEKEESKKRKEYNAIIAEYEVRASDIEYEYERENNSGWTLNQYKSKFHSHAEQGKIEPLLKQHIQTLKETHHYGTAMNYNMLYNKLELFDDGFENRRFSGIDLAYVNTFNTWMEKKNISANTRQSYLKKLRAIYNKAVKDNQADKSIYPFGKNGFSVFSLSAETQKRYMPTEYLEKLKTKKSLSPQTEYARHLFLFSYYCYGMSFKDMALLSKTNIITYNNGEYIVYKRVKTQQKKASPISIKITGNIRDTIEFLTQYRKPIDGYLLPVLTKPTDTPIALHKHINVMLSLYNEYLHRLADEFGINIELTSYVARHTTAMQLQEKKIPEHVISQMLGHKELKTTKVYLDSLDTGVIDEAVKVL